MSKSTEKLELFAETLKLAPISCIDRKYASSSNTSSNSLLSLQSADVRQILIQKVKCLKTKKKK